MNWEGKKNSDSFPDSSVSKQSACNAGDLGLIPGSGKSSGEGIGYPLQCFWASLVAQWVKNLPAMWETWVWFLGWDYALENEIWRTLQYSGLENSMDCIVHWVAKSQTWLSYFHFQDLVFSAHQSVNISYSAWPDFPNFYFTTHFLPRFSPYLDDP